MRFHKLDLNQLVALDAMLQTRSITRAAQQLHLSQPAMSNCLARLREYFGDELLVKVGRHLELTPRGELLREAMRDLMQRVETTLKVEHRFDPTRSDRTFLVAASDYSALVLIPHLLQLFEEEHATAKLRLLPQVGDCAAALERGEADLLIIPRPYASSAHPCETLFEETFTCLVWTGSQIARNGLDTAGYRQGGHVVMQPVGSARPAFGSTHLQSCGIDRRIEVQTYSFVTEPALLIGTERIATVHSRLARWAMARMPLTAFVPPIDFPVMEQSIQWHKHRSADAGLVWLLDRIRAAAQRMDAVSTPLPGSSQRSVV